MRVPATARDVLATPAARAAVMAGDRGTVIRLAREALGMRQSDLGQRLGYSQSTISRVESGKHHANDMSLLSSAARLLGIPPPMLGLAGTAPDGDAQPGHRDVLTAPWATRRDNVRRLEFLGLVAGTAAGSILTDDVEPGRLGARDVARLRVDLQRLYELDDHHGGSDVYALAVHSLRALRRNVQGARYRTATGRALWSMVGELTEHAGWLAYDADRHDEARQWWLEALHTARLADDGRVETVVMTSMSLQASRCGAGTEAVRLAEAAGKSATAWGTPRLRSLLLAREAMGHSRCGDRVASGRALRRASTQLDRGSGADDPLWLDFYGEADFAWHEAGVARDLGQLPDAERSIRRALAALQSGYPRNHALYLAELAAILVTRRRLEEGVHVAAQAVSRASDLGSGRVDAQVGQLRHMLAPYVRLPEVGEFLQWSGQMMAGRLAPTAV